MAFYSLHSIELQRIYHACDQSSILSLARCCRFTLAAASSPVAWRSASPVSVCSLQADLGRLLSRSLLRFASGVDVILLLESDGDLLTYATMNHACPMSEFPPIVSFDCRCLWDMPIEWMLLRPAFAELRSLSLILAAGMDWSMRELAPKLRSLRTLYLSLSSPADSNLDLHRFASLTSVCLDFQVCSGRSLAEFTDQLTRCPKLTRFRLVAYPVNASLVWLLAQLTTVEELEFDSLTIAAGDASVPAEWAQSFFAPPKLRSLIFTRSSFTIALASSMASRDDALVHESFRRLTIQAAPGSLFPDPLLIRSWLDRLPPSLEQLELVCLTRDPLDLNPAYQRVDPRVRVMTAPPPPSREEQNARLRQRFQAIKAAAPQKAGCIVS